MVAVARSRYGTSRLSRSCRTCRRRGREHLSRARWGDQLWSPSAM